MRGEFENKTVIVTGRASGMGYLSGKNFYKRQWAKMNYLRCKNYQNKRRKNYGIENLQKGGNSDFAF